MHGYMHTIPHFEAITGFEPYPWQVRLYQKLLRGDVPFELTLPTGTGKTSAVLLYLLALAQGADLPRRLAYIVDRRAIVDQTAEQLDDWVTRLETIPEVDTRIDALSAFPKVERLVPIGVLRGGSVDTGQWRIDPARPAVVIGTVDMIGSRLLFSGYSDGRTRRALHAGLLGYDTTVILDEAHLSTPMAHLLRGIYNLQTACWQPRFRVLTMSATPDSPINRGGVSPEDHAHPTFRKRLEARKELSLHHAAKAKKRDRLVELALAYQMGSILCFVRTVKDAVGLERKLAGKVGADRVALLTGTLRGQERSAISESPIWQRFRPQRNRVDDESVYLVATAAGEVGVDLDADHVVMDLAPIDSVIQRIGRVNRTGDSNGANVHIVYNDADVEVKKPAKPKTWRDRLNTAHRRTLKLLKGLAELSPRTLMSIDPVARKAASTPSPRVGRLERERVDLLAATSMSLRDAGVAVFLRGDTDNPERPETQVVWRNDIETLIEQNVAESALGIFPPLPHEVLKAPAHYVAAELGKIAERTAGKCLLRDRTGSLHARRLSELDDIDFGTIFLPACLGGLSPAGLFIGSEKRAVEDIADSNERVRYRERDSSPPDWIDQAITLRIPLHEPDDETEDWLIYARRRIGEMTLGADNDDVTRLAASAQTLEEHGTSVGEAAGALARKVGLSPELVEAVQTAGRYHDVGKSRRVWQLAAGNRGKPMAKSRSGVMNAAWLGGFRHEFGSLVDATQDGSSSELTLHLIAAHHGHARPGFPNPRQWDPEIPETVNARLADEVERRFAILQQTYGPWALAWLESLVKAADAWVSAGNRP